MDLDKHLSEKQKTIATEVIKEIKDRLAFLMNVGLDYLALSRSSKSLSGGEAQRIRLATQIGSQLVGVLYILDENCYMNVIVIIDIYVYIYTQLLLSHNNELHYQTMINRHNTTISNMLVRIQENEILMDRSR